MLLAHNTTTTLCFVYSGYSIIVLAIILLLAPGRELLSRLLKFNFSFNTEGQALLLGFGPCPLFGTQQSGNPAP